MSTLKIPQLEADYTQGSNAYSFRLAQTTLLLSPVASESNVIQCPSLGACLQAPGLPVDDAQSVSQLICPQNRTQDLL